MYAKDLNIEPFTDRLTFAMDRDLIDLDLVDQMSDADPSSREYRQLMKSLRINGRNHKINPRWRDEYDD